jgi:hypothetical protein
MVGPPLTKELDKHLDTVMQADVKPIDEGAKV